MEKTRTWRRAIATENQTPSNLWFLVKRRSSTRGELFYLRMFTIYPFHVLQDAIVHLVQSVSTARLELAVVIGPRDNVAVFEVLRGIKCGVPHLITDPRQCEHRPICWLLGVLKRGTFGLWNLAIKIGLGPIIDCKGSVTTPTLQGKEYLGLAFDGPRLVSIKIFQVHAVNA